MDTRKNNKWREKLNQFPQGDVNGNWDNMEALLDKHIPIANKKNWRPLYLILLLLILVLGICNYPSWKNKFVNDGATSLKKDDLKEQLRKKNSVLTAKKPGIEITDAKQSQKTEKYSTTTGTHRKEDDTTYHPLRTDATYTGWHTKKMVTRKSKPSKSILNNGNAKINSPASGYIHKKQQPPPGLVTDKTGENKPDPVETRVSLHNDLNQKQDSSSQIAENKPTNEDSVFAEVQKTKKQLINKKLKFSLGAGFNYFLAINDQQQSIFNAKGNRSDLSNFAPVIMGRFYIKDKIYLQGEMQFNAPQLSQKVLLDKKFTPMPGPSPTGISRVEKSIFSEKLFYMHLPFSVHVSPLKNIFIGGGFQYSRFKKAVGLTEEKLLVSGRPDSIISRLRAPIDDSMKSAVFKPSEWGYLADASFKWNRINVGIRYTKSFQSFLRIAPAGSTPFNTTNSSLSFFLRYELWHIKTNKKK
jgi:hypothetical protein